MENNTITFKQILFDLQLRIKQFVIIKFLNTDECNKFYTNLLSDKRFKCKSPDRIPYRDVTKIAIDSTGKDITHEFEFYLTRMPGFDDYIQIGEDSFIKP